MDTKFDLSIKKPCSQNFNDFLPTDAGGYCNVCQKEVIDFTRMTEKDILNFFREKAEGTCGRLNKDQLRTYFDSYNHDNSNKWKWLRFGVIGVSSLLLVQESSAQNSTPTIIEADQRVQNQSIENKMFLGKHLVSGRVVDRLDGYPLPGVNIVIKGTVIGTVTDMDGNFSFNDPLVEGEILVFSFIGMETEEFKIKKNMPEIIELNMMQMSCDFMGEIAVNEVYSSKISIWEKVKNIFR